MRKRAIKISDVLENELFIAISYVLLGIMVMVLCGLLIHFLGYWKSSYREMSRIIASLGVGAGAVIVVVAVYRCLDVRKLSRIPFTCPYCDNINYFPEAPTEDFDCDTCDRTVHFQDSKPIPVRTVACGSCGTDHRVAVNVLNYTCDRCNRPLKLRPDSAYRTTALPQREALAQDDVLQNYDVLLVGIDKRRENEIAFKLQNLLLTNLPEARRLMSTASNKTPLVVGYELPQRKAEAVRRSLQDLGASVTLRPTGAGTRVPQRTR
jgi:hypothetical protein